jgi:GT2 family glycosyltransferase
MSDNLSIPRISVIATNYNGARFLRRLLSSLREQQGVELQVIIVDRFSADESEAILAEHPEVTVVRHSPESGMVTGYSVGAERAEHNLLFFCNEDMWFDSNCLRLLAEQIDLDRRIAAADPWQWTYDGRDWIHGGVRFLPPTMRSRAAYPLRRYEFTVPLACGDLVPFACAGAFLIHRRVYDEVGGWDRSFFLDAEDVDLFLRMWQQAWKCVSVPEAKVYHAVGASNVHVMSGSGVPVSKARYISSRSSNPIIAVKYFGLRALAVSLFFWCEVTLRHAALLRGKQTAWDLLAGWTFFRRLGPAINYRWANSAVRRKFPGESLFTAAEFQGR